MTSEYLTSLHWALNDSLSSGIFIDTKFYAFSKRGPSGQVCEPKPLYANSHVLRRIPYFNTLLSDGYLEGIFTDIKADFPENQEKFGDDYDYWSDSDLEDDCEDGGIDPDAAIVVASEITTDARVPPFEPNNLGKVVIVKDVAFATLKALLLYIYTGEIIFAPLSSLPTENTPSTGGTYETIPRSSPKSLYRLADKYDIPNLKKLAFGKILADLKPHNLVKETLSRFTSCYPEVISAEVQHLSSALSSSGSSSVMDLLRTSIRKFAVGDMPYSSDAIVLLFETMSDLSRCNQKQAVPLQKKMSTEPHWVKLKEVLVKSLTTGIFLDIQVHAYSSFSDCQTGKKAIPIYFSRSVVEKWFENILKCSDPDVRLDKEQDWYDSDSDDEGEQSSVDGEVTPSLVVREGESESVSGDELIVTNGASTKEDPTPKFVFKTGTLATWKSVLFWLYTHEVSFAPLRSQGSEVRRAGVQETLSQFPHQPRPCSPKSVYALTDKIGVASLRDLALVDLESKMLSSNIVAELFSRFTSSYKVVLIMENRVLGARFDKLECRNMTSENIKTMASGQHAHRSDSLSQIFERLTKRNTRHFAPVITKRDRFGSRVVPEIPVRMERSRWILQNRALECSIPCDPAGSSRPVTDPAGSFMSLNS